MLTQTNCNFITEQLIPTVSKTFTNPASDILSLQVTGGKGEYYIEGRNNNIGDWQPLAAINLSNFAVAQNGKLEPGLYEIAIASIRELRVRLENAESPVTIFGQMISLEET